MVDEQIPNPSKKIDDLDKPFIDNPNFIQGLSAPSKLQIKNYIQNTLKPKIAPTTFKYSDLVNWINEHCEIPTDGNEPYVIDKSIEVNDYLPSASIIRVAISTKI